MNYLTVSSSYKLVDDESLCENNRLDQISVSDYYELEDILISYSYDFIPNNILIDAKGPNGIEEVLATPSSLTLTCDSKKINYDKTIFLIKWFCNKNAVIEKIDDKKYCKCCYVDNNQVLNSEFEKIKEILESDDKTTGLSTSKKIQFILINNDKKLTAKEIYELGVPWSASGKTPRNTVYARCSTLYQEGVICKEGTRYFVEKEDE